MTTPRLRASILASVAYACSAPAAPTSAIPSLHVAGNRVLDDQGREVRLRGVNLEDPILLERQDIDGDGAPDPHLQDVEQDFERIAGLGANVVRLVANPGYYARFGERYFTDYYDQLVELAERHGLYAVVDFHAIGEPGVWYPAEYDETIPDLAVPLYYADLALAEAFWRDAAQRYGALSHVLFDIYNEPANPNGGFGWSDWRPIGERLIGVIREHSPNVVLGPGPEWTSDLTDVGGTPFSDPNLIYAVHFYPGSLDPGADLRSQCEERFGYLAATYPVIVSEWGYEEGGDETTDGTRAGYGEPLLDYIDERGLHWIAFIYHPYAGPPMLELDWRSHTDFGRFVAERLSSP